MSYRALAGEKKCLVFPVMCDAHVKLDYSDNIPDRQTISTDDDEVYSFFGWDDSFTLQTVLTPYEVNGLNWEVPNATNPYGVSGVTTSKKTMPGNQEKNHTLSTISVSLGSVNLESRQYFHNSTSTSRNQYEMMIFYNTNVQLSLINTTPTISQPAEYKIKFTIVADGVSDSLTSDTVITADSSYFPRVSTDYQTLGFDGAIAKYQSIGQMGTGDINLDGANTGTRITLAATANEDEYFMVGEYLYIMNPIKKVATVTAVTSSYIDIAYESGCSYASDISGKTLYREAPKEATYLLHPQNITATFHKNTGKMGIFYEGSLVTSKVHSQYPIALFNFDRTDTYIGSNNSGDFDAFDRKQFMGELHELAIIKGPDSPNGKALLPNYRKTLLYLRFQEGED